MIDGLALLFPPSTLALFLYTSRDKVNQEKCQGIGGRLG